MLDHRFRQWHQQAGSLLLGDDETDLAVHLLLVMGDMLAVLQPLASSDAVIGVVAEELEELDAAFAKAFVADARLHAGFQRLAGPPGDALSVAEGSEVADRLQRVAERMSQVQHLPDSLGLGRVLLQIEALDGQRKFQHLLHDLLVTLQNLGAVRQQELVQLGIRAEQGMLQDLPHSIVVFFVGQGTERVGADQHLVGRIEAADQVLVALEVDGGLAPEGGVAHAQQRGRHQGQAATTHVQRCGQGRHVADHSPAEADKTAVTGHPIVGGAAHDPQQAVDVFVRLAAFQHDVVRGKLLEELGGMGVEHPHHVTPIFP